MVRIQGIIRKDAKIERNQEIVSLSWSGLSYREIAEKLNTSVAVVHQVIARDRKKRYG